MTNSVGPQYLPGSATSTTQAPARMTGAQRANGKVSRGEKDDSQDTAFEKELAGSDKTNTSDVKTTSKHEIGQRDRRAANDANPPNKQGAAAEDSAPTIKPKSVESTGSADGDKVSKTATSPDDDQSQTSETPNDAPSIPSFASQTLQGMLAIGSLQPAASADAGGANTPAITRGGKAIGQLPAPNTKSTSALFNAKSKLLALDNGQSQDLGVVQGDDKPQQLETSQVTVNANESHWVFTPTVDVKPTATAQTSDVTKAPSTETILAKSLNGSAPQQPNAAGEATDTDADTETDGTAAGTAGKATLTAGKGSATSISVMKAVTEKPTNGDAAPDQQSDNPAENFKQASQTFDAAVPTDKTALTTRGAPVEKISTTVDPSSSQAPNVVAQVKTGITDALKDTGATAEMTPAQTSAPVRPATPMATSHVLRSIDVTLEPSDLGSVRLRLSLKSNALTIDAETSKASTAKLLNESRDSLEKDLRTAGYDVSAIKVTDASAATGTMLGGGSSFQDGSQARFAYNGRDGGGDMQQRRSSDNPQQQGRKPGGQNQNTAASDSLPSRQSNALYI